MNIVSYDKFLIRCIFKTTTVSFFGLCLSCVIVPRKAFPNYWVIFVCILVNVGVTYGCSN